jgi:hypothetical protein
MHSRVAFRVALAVIVVLGATRATYAQGVPCFGDDGFSVPGACCTPVTPNLPTFPQVVIPTAGCCFQDCNPVFQWQNQIALGNPMPIFCDLYIAPLTIFSAVTPTQTGVLVMKYARTWMEFDPVSVRQIWRFLVNIDLVYQPTTAALVPCPVPPCGASTGLGLPVHFIGSVDYAFDCSTGTFSAAINLTHLCEQYMHAPGTQRPVPAPFSHPDHIYSFAGPTPFIFGPTPPLAGPVIADAQRSTVANFFSAFSWTCLSETPVFGGNIMPTTQRCQCTTSATPGLPLFTDYQMGFGYGCSSASGQVFTPIPLPPAFPTGILSFSIGRYALPFGTYPGPEEVQLWLGVVAAPDPCPSGLALPFHIVYGVSTQGGNFGQLFPDPSGVTVTTNHFLDLANMNVVNTTVAPNGLVLGIGALFVSTQVWSLNTP